MVGARWSGGRRLLGPGGGLGRRRCRCRRQLSTAAPPGAVSRRAARALGLLPSYLAEARSAPAACLNLSVAENQMLADLLTPRLARGAGFADELIYYQPTPGREDARRAVARYMSSSLYGGLHAVDPEELILGAGCNAVLENLFFSIAEPGSAVLVPAPSYAAFDFDLSARAGMELRPVMPEGLANQVRQAGLIPSAGGRASYTLDAPRPQART